MKKSGMKQMHKNAIISLESLLNRLQELSLWADLNYHKTVERLECLYMLNDSRINKWTDESGRQTAFITLSSPWKRIGYPVNITRKLLTRCGVSSKHSITFPDWDKNFHLVIIKQINLNKYKYF